jgi:hypothetical protein
MSTYILPQALVFQEFQAVGDVSDQDLRACIIGPNYQVVDSQAEGELGAYDPNSETCYSWPNREAGAVVQDDSVRVFIANALLQYFYNPSSGSDTIKAIFCDTVDVVGNADVKNAIRAAATNWKTYDSYARDAQLLERDVQVGDVVKVNATVDGSPVTLWSTIAGFLNDELPGAIAAATEDENNASAEAEESSTSLAPAVSWSKVGYGTVSTDISTVSDPDHPEQCYIDGVAADEYVITCTQGGEPADALLNIVSASGTDDEFDVTPSDWGVATAFGNKGLSVTFTRSASDAFEAGMQWVVSVQFGVSDIDATSGGDYEGPTDTTYIITVSTGGEIDGASGNPYITVSTSTGIDSSGPHEVTALDDEIEIGSYGVTIEFSAIGGFQFGLYKGDRYYIQATAPSAGPVRTLLLGHNLPNELLGLDDSDMCTTPPDLAVTLYINNTVEIPEDRQGFAPLTNWNTSDTQICLADGILSYDASWTDSGGTLLALPVKGGTAYTTYNAVRTVNANIAGVISSADEISDALGSEPLVGNPLATGVYFALLNSGGEPVVYISVPTDDLAGYNEALGQLTKRDDVHGLVPLTFDVDVHNAVKAHALAMSTPEKGRWRRAIVCAELAESTAVVDSTDNSGSSVLATIKDDPSATSLQYTFVEITTSGIDLTTLGVRAGDIVRALYTTDGFGSDTYSEYVVDAVLSGDSLRLVSGPDAPVSVASKIEIWRNLTTTEQASAVAALSGLYSDRRVTNVWPDYFESGTDSLEGYYLACCYAGLRSGALPQRGLTNVSVTGPTSVDRATEKFTEEQLNTLAAGGTCIIIQEPQGTVYVRHAVTTDMTDINTREEMVTSNVDSISYAFLESVEPFIGVSNLIDETIEQIRVELENTKDFLLTNTDVRTVGGQLVDMTITSLERHPTLQDRLVAVLDITIPYPLNNVEVHLVI